jgi:hypothetical protein
MRKRDVIRNMLWAWLLVGISVGFTVMAWYFIMVIRAIPQ